MAAAGSAGWRQCACSVCLAMPYNHGRAFAVLPSNPARDLKAEPHLAQQVVRNLGTSPTSQVGVDRGPVPVEQHDERRRIALDGPPDDLSVPCRLFDHR